MADTRTPITMDYANRARVVSDFIAPLRVHPGTTVRLSRDFNPSASAKTIDKAEGEQWLQAGVELLAEYQARLAAQSTYGVLVVLQAIDAAGKDGTIRHVMSGVNPQGVRVESFKVPSAEELAHDYLWRYTAKLPKRGEIGIFNRSYYEEVLVTRVHPELIAHRPLPKKGSDQAFWDKRFGHINDWEDYLVENGIHIVKVFLNLSKDEQRRRFLRRIDESDRNWKFSASDIQERAHWDDYQAAFSDMLSKTSTERAPWFVVPADHKWFARMCVAAIIANALITIDPQFPTVDDQVRAELAAAKSALEAE